MVQNKLFSSVLRLCEMNWSHVGAHGISLGRWSIYFSVASCSTHSHTLQAGGLWWLSCCCLAQSVLIKALSSWKNSHPGISRQLHSGAKFSGVSSLSEFVKISISFIGLSRTVFLIDTASEKHENSPNHKDARKESQIGTKNLFFFHLKITNFKCILLNIWCVILAQWPDVVSLIYDQNLSTNGGRDTWYCNV